MDAMTNLGNTAIHAMESAVTIIKIFVAVAMGIGVVAYFFTTIKN